MCCCVADKVFFSIALYMGDGGYQVVRMLIISVRHFTAVRRARRNNGGVYKDTSENSDALGLGIKLQVRWLLDASCCGTTSRLAKLPTAAAGLTYSPVSHQAVTWVIWLIFLTVHRFVVRKILPCNLGILFRVRLMVMSLLKAPL